MTDETTSASAGAASPAIDARATAHSSRSRGNPLTERVKTVLFITCIFVATLVGLAFAGVNAQASWQTFVPDLVVGVVTAGGFAGAIAWVQASSDERRSRDDAITRAYEELLDALGNLQLSDLTTRETLQLMSRVGVKMINFVERSEDTDGALTLWFEAERRYLRHLALSCALSFHEDDDELAIEQKCVPFRKGIQQLVANIRRGRMTDITAEMSKQAQILEQTLRAAGRWDDAETGV